jgi:hypothetical protein
MNSVVGLYLPVGQRFSAILWSLYKTGLTTHAGGCDRRRGHAAIIQINAVPTTSTFQGINSWHIGVDRHLHYT